MTAHAAPAAAFPRRVWRALAATGNPALVSGLVILLYFVAAVTAPLWSPYDPSAVMVGLPLAPPGLEHFFGTDSLGRDVFSRVVHGSRPVLVMSLSAAFLAVIV